MKEERKLRVCILLGIFLSMLIIAYNISGQYIMPEIEGYLKRRIYYERVISKKGLSLHNAVYWKKASD